MGMVERRQGEGSFSQRSAIIQEIKNQQRELIEKMEKIRLFPGSLDELVKSNGGEWELIKLPGQKQFLEGRRLRWKEIDNDPKHLVIKRDLLHPLNWLKIEFLPYQGILVEAVRLEADALIHYTQRSDSFGGIYVDMGVPIKRIDTPSNPQK